MESLRVFKLFDYFTKNQAQSQRLLSDIAAVIKKVDKNQCSAGQGWREVKRIMQSAKNDERPL